MLLTIKGLPQMLSFTITETSNSNRVRNWKFDDQTPASSITTEDKYSGSYELIVAATFTDYQENIYDPNATAFFTSRVFDTMFNFNKDELTDEILNRRKTFFEIAMSKMVEQSRDAGQSVLAYFPKLNIKAAVARTEEGNSFCIETWVTKDGAAMHLCTSTLSYENSTHETKQDFKYGK